RDTLEKLGMCEETYGWNLEMQMKAAQAGLRILEIPVKHRRRTGGESKISGTFPGTFVAGTRIVATLFRVAASRCPVEHRGCLQCWIWNGFAPRRSTASRLNF